MSWKNALITSLSFINNSRKRNLIRFSRSLRNQTGIEIGGPSPAVFNVKMECPVYVYAKEIDGVNYSNNTVWEGELRAGKTYRYFQNKHGYQHIAEASSLPSIPDKRYDFLLSSHNLEHVANPLKALLEWNRILKTGGKMVLVLPDKTRTFDRKRAYTSFEHVLSDYHNNVDETDPTHLNEILLNTEFTNEAPADIAAFSSRLANNIEYRVAHHHVFSFSLLKEMLDFAGFKCLYQQTAPPFHLFTVAEKVKDAGH